MTVKCESQHQNQQYQQCLDSIFASYMAVKPLLKGKFDREIRKPWIVLGIAKDLGLLPARHSTVRITGSKGKGTTSRLIAQGVGLAKPQDAVGLLVSPEEIDHVDRVRVNGETISFDEFVQCYNELQPALREREKLFVEHDYFSPSGLFLLIALCWFKKRGVRWFVLEGGRGVAFDEVGNIPSQVSVVTSVFSEHLNCLGPTERDVALDKLSVGASSQTIFLGPSAERWNQIVNIIPLNRCEFVDVIPNEHELPSWVELNRVLAARAVASLVSTDFYPSRLNLSAADFPSFGTFELAGVSGFYECLISRESLDSEFFASFLRDHVNHRANQGSYHQANLHAGQYAGQYAAVVSLPDDKDLDGITSTLVKGFGIPVFHVPLSGTRGYLDYALTEKNYSSSIVSRVQFNDAAGFRKIFLDFCHQRNLKFVAVLGTQSFIRLFRRSVNLGV